MAMRLDILGELLQKHGLSGYIPYFPPAFNGITVAMCYCMSWQMAIQLATRDASGSGDYKNL